MSAREFLDRLEAQGLLEDSVVADLRRQLEGASSRVSAESLAKLLVDNGHLTKFQATKLINEVTAKAEERRAARAETAEARRQQAEDAEAKPTDSVDELLDLPPEAGESSPSPAGARPASAAPSGTPEDDLTRLTDEAAPPRSAAKNKPADASTAEGSSSAGEPKASSEGQTGAAASVSAPDVMADGLEPIDDEPLDLTSGIEGLPETSGLSDDAGLGSLDAFAQPAAAPAGIRKKAIRSNPWDSPLILIGGFSLILLMGLSVVLWYSLTRGTAAEYFQAAEQDYRDGAYVNAAAKADKFLRYYPRDPNASKARVMRAMSQFRIEAEGARDPAKALDAAQRILPTIENEEAFGEFRPELATMLPDIARAFAQRAKAAKSVEEAEKLLALVDQAMELVNNPSYVPTTARKTQANVIEEIEETVAQVRRDMERERELVATLQGMKAAIDAGNTREAFRLRDALVADYPGLETHPDVLAKVAEIAERERDLVVVRQEDLSPVTEDTRQSDPRVILYTRAGKGIPDVEGQTVIVPIHGAVFGIDAAAGRVKWRRFVGFDSNSLPLRVSREPDADAILVDTDHHALVRVSAATGEMVWRLPVGESFYPPVAWRDRLLVTTKSGRILNVDMASGTSRRQTELHQEVDAPAGVDDRLSVFYQVGENDNLYLLSVDTMECRDVFYLGHRRGAIVVPPVYAVGHLFIAVNAGPNFSFLYVYSTDSNGLSLKPAQDPVRLDGHVITKPLVSGRRLLVTTSLGAVVALEINPQQTPSVTREISPLPATRSVPVLSYPLVDQNSIWIADQILLAFDVQASQGQFVRRWSAHDGDAFVAPLQRVGDALVHVRQTPGAAGYRVTAVDGATGKNVYWQINLGFPVLTLSGTSAEGVLAISSLGAAYPITSDSAKEGIAEAPADARLGNDSFQAALPLGDGRHVIYSTVGKVLIYDPRQGDREMKLLRLGMPDGSGIAHPIVLAGGLCVPLKTGPVHLFDLTSGGQMVQPFQPAISAGTRVNWRPPVLVGVDGKELAVADDQQHLYRLGLVDTGGRRLAAVEQITTKEQIVGPLALNGNVLFGAVARSDGDVLVAYTVPRFKEEPAIALKGRVTWGPALVGDTIMIATEGDGLMAIDAAGKTRWTTPLPYGPLAGTPYVADDQIVLASRSGTLWRLSAKDGAENWKYELGEPLGGGPVRSGNELWIPSADGTLFVVAYPQP